MPPTPKINTYKILLAQVRQTLLEGQARIEIERVKIYWQTGKVIQKDILRNNRAEYGTEVVKRLAKDLNVDLSVLQRCIQFAKTYPRFPIVGGHRQFTWSHYLKFITITDDRKRVSLEKAAEKNAWSAEELAARINEEKVVEISHDSKPAAPVEKLQPAQRLLTPLCGKIYHYQIVQRPTLGGEGEPELFLDLGFGNFIDLSEDEATQYKNGDIVELDGHLKGFKFAKVDGGVKDLYTYQAVVEKLIDGDTLKVRFYLGGRFRRRETLRLRGLDCPEIDTKEGQAAKIFVQSYIKEAQTIVVRSSRSDKWDRYLADVFLPQSEAGPEIYLNNMLLEKGFAVRME